jgi:hypothetical protein
MNAQYDYVYDAILTFPTFLCLRIICVVPVLTSACYVRSIVLTRAAREKVGENVAHY